MGEARIQTANNPNSSPSHHKTRNMSNGHECP